MLLSLRINAVFRPSVLLFTFIGPVNQLLHVVYYIMITLQYGYFSGPSSSNLKVHYDDKDKQCPYTQANRQIEENRKLTLVFIVL